MARIKMTREGMSGYLIFFGLLMLLCGEIWPGIICLGLGVLTLIILLKSPN